VNTNVPARILWAVEQLDIHPRHHILEIGCGTGIAARLICERLTTGRLVAIDRSATAITAARKRNRAHEASGQATFVQGPLTEADFGRQRFDRILAINVNVFWRQPARELEAIKRISKPAARLCLVFQPPSAAQTGRIAEATPRFLRDHGFSNIEVTTRDLQPATTVCIRAAAGKAAPTG
jgi:ubiquinone/menaquinone biosynthesis C-methylase UbiE